MDGDVDSLSGDISVSASALERMGWRRRQKPSQRGANGSTDVVESVERIECDVSDPQHNALFHELAAMHIVVIHLA